MLSQKKFFDRCSSAEAVSESFLAIRQLDLHSRLHRREHLDATVDIAGRRRLRDFAELANYDVATWCRGEATRWGGDTVMPYAAGQPVEIGGVCVVPGDYVYVDAAGGVVIPAADVGRVLDEALRIEADDSRFAELIRAEDADAPQRGGT